MQIDANENFMRSEFEKSSSCRGLKKATKTLKTLSKLKHERCLFFMYCKNASKRIHLLFFYANFLTDWSNKTTFLKMHKIFIWRVCESTDAMF